MNYRNEVERTARIAEDAHQNYVMGALGLSGEAGELVDEIKKVVFHGKELNRDYLIKEMGDVRWYLEYLSIAFGISMQEVEERNVAKLRERYPAGFVTGGGNR